MASLIERHLQKLLEEHRYDTVSNFLNFYREYTTSGYGSLKEFFQNYTPCIKTGQHTCVGLALELWKSICELDVKYPGISDYFYLVSCEEHVDSTNYVRLGNNIEAIASTVEKEHVLLALRFNISGRTGVLLCDPGYHVGRVITVMQDKSYPHTGWFVQSDESGVTKQYNYSFAPNSDKYVEWQDKVTKDGVQTEIQSLIYMARPYLTAVDVTERRNLVYNFRSFLARDAKGHLVAGLYFKVKENHDEFTLFYQENGTKKRVKLFFRDFLQGEKIDKTSMRKPIGICAQQMGLSSNGLEETIKSLAEAVSDRDFVTELLEINRRINAMAEDN